jgi:hypothetical protein
MTRDDVIRMAHEADMSSLSLIDVGYLERFATLVAQQEREACAKVCEHYGMALDYGGNQYFRSHECMQAAATIRARTNSTVKQSLTVAEAVAAEREACLAEIETGIWVDMSVDEILASIADAIRARGAK